MKLCNSKVKISGAKKNPLIFFITDIDKKNNTLFIAKL